MFYTKVVLIFQFQSFFSLVGLNSNLLLQLHLEKNIANDFSLKSHSYRFIAIDFFYHIFHIFYSSFYALQ
jgi:hypothetical protein